MPTNGKAPDYLVDTSVAVALVLTDHPGHKVVFEALGNRRLGLAGHAAFETYSVLTRLPAPARRTAAAATRLIEVNFPQSRFLPAEAATELTPFGWGPRPVGLRLHRDLVSARSGLGQEG